MPTKRRLVNCFCRPVIWTLIYVFMTVMWSACQPSAEATATPIPTPTIIPSRTPSPPVNANLIRDSEPITAKNGASIQPLTKLWSGEYQGYTGRLEIAFSSDSASLALANGSQARIWDILTNSERTTIGSNDQVIGGTTAVAFSPDETMLALSSGTKVEVWNLSSPEKASLILSPSNGMYIPPTIEIPATFGVPTVTIRTIPKMIVAVAFNSDGTLLAALNENNQAVIWNLKTGAELTTLEPDTDKVHIDRGKIVFSADSSFLASTHEAGLDVVGLGGVGLIWNIKSGKYQSILNETSEGSTSLALSPDGMVLAFAGTEGNIYLWDVKGNLLKTTLVGHTEKVTSLAFNPSGDVLASGSLDSSAILWDVSSGRQLGSLGGLDGSKIMVAFSPNGKFLMTDDETGGKLWGVQPLDDSVERAGVRVVISGRGASTTLEAWQKAIPATWLAAEGTSPRYEIKIMLKQSEVERCSYDIVGPDTSNLGRTLVRIRIVISIEIVDLDTFETVASQDFQGGTPDACPASQEFLSTVSELTSEGTPPDVSEFDAWIKENAKLIGLE